MTGRKRFVVLLISVFGFFISTNPHAETNGPEITEPRGWMAYNYAYWKYIPEWSSIHPIPQLWTPYQGQSPAQVLFSEQELDKYGSGVDILEFNPNPKAPDLNEWMRIYFSQQHNIRRPFFLSYEHMESPSPDYRYRWTKNSAGVDAYIDMSDPWNRMIFKQDIDFMYRNIMVRYPEYYLRYNGRFLIHMWCTQVLLGDFGSLIEEVKAQYPISIISNELNRPTDPDGRERFKAMDGFMAYAMVDPKGNYMNMVNDYIQNARDLKKFLVELEKEVPGKHWLVLPTYQFAYDDTNIPNRQYPDGTPMTPAMIPRTQDERIYFAKKILDGIWKEKIFDKILPQVIYSENFEGAAAIQTRVAGKMTHLKPCEPKQLQFEKPDFKIPVCGFVGYVTDRLEFMKEFFEKLIEPEPDPTPPPPVRTNPEPHRPPQRPPRSW